jgi:alkylated DNA repair dioxygenase AlkB
MEKINFQNGWGLFDANFISQEEGNILFDELLQEIIWQSGEISLFGKTYPVPRLEAFYADDNKSYGYSGKRLKTMPFNPILLGIKEKIEAQSNFKFNSVLCNLYRDGNDSNGWHADNERELGQQPIIASVSLGCMRIFEMKHNQTNQKLRFELNSGSLLILGGETQHYWKHQIAKKKSITTPRINLTFRTILD